MNTDIVKLVAQELLNRKLTIGTAESCTGGLLGHLLTRNAGSSIYYLGSITAYSYDIKEKLLGVQKSTLEKYGAVSEETVLEMAEGGQKALETDIMISISGIAGPGGGLPNKPVGTVCFCVLTPFETRTFTRLFSGDRIAVQEQTAIAGFESLFEILSNQ